MECFDLSKNRKKKMDGQINRKTCNQPISGTNSDVVGIWSETISIRIDIARSVVIPKSIFSVRSSLVDAGVKKPVIETAISGHLMNGTNINYKRPVEDTKVFLYWYIQAFSDTQCGYKKKLEVWQTFLKWILDWGNHQVLKNRHYQF